MSCIKETKVEQVMSNNTCCCTCTTKKDDSIDPIITVATVNYNVFGYNYTMFTQATSIMMYLVNLVTYRQKTHWSTLAKAVRHPKFKKSYPLLDVLMYTNVTLNEIHSLDVNIDSDVSFNKLMNTSVDISTIRTIIDKKKCTFQLESDEELNIEKIRFILNCFYYDEKHLYGIYVECIESYGSRNSDRPYGSRNGKTNRTNSFEYVEVPISKLLNNTHGLHNIHIGFKQTDKLDLIVDIDNVNIKAEVVAKHLGLDCDYVYSVNQDNHNKKHIIFKLKEGMTPKEQYNLVSHNIPYADLSIYLNEDGFIRLPNCNKIFNGKHIIKKGTMEDFILIKH